MSLLLLFVRTSPALHQPVPAQPPPSPPPLSHFASAVARWDLLPDGEPFSTATSHLLPVLFRGQPAIVKHALVPQEQKGAQLLEWWQGNGAAPVYGREGCDLLLARATGSRDLREYSFSGRDDEATRILCDATARLHASPLPPQETLSKLSLTPLEEWFHDLASVARAQGGLFQGALNAASRLFRSPEAPMALHGDIHHGNVLDFGPHGWLAIDPKGLLGERGFDYANLFCNPDIAFEEPDAPKRRPIAATREQFEARLAIVSTCSGLAPQRLLLWLAAWGGLSAAWFLQDQRAPGVSLVISEWVQAALRNSG